MLINEEIENMGPESLAHLSSSGMAVLFIKKR